MFGKGKDLKRQRTISTPSEVSEEEEEEEEQEAVTHRSEQPPIAVHGQVAVSSQPLDHHLPHRRGLELQPDWGRRHLVSGGQQANQEPPISSYETL